jgi:hypothetical protein
MEENDNISENVEEIPNIEEKEVLEEKISETVKSEVLEEIRPKEELKTKMVKIVLSEIDFKNLLKFMIDDEIALGQKPTAKDYGYAVKRLLEIYSKGN